MSDLLPLVAAVLKDKAAADAQEELAAMKKELGTSHAVEIIRAGDDEADGEAGNEDEVVVYAAADFVAGKYGGNPNLWQVDLERDPSTNPCLLSALRGCTVCVGGGFPVASLNDDLANSAGLEGWLTTGINDEDDEDAIGVNICFCPYSIWLSLILYGWPKEEWEAVIQADDMNPDDIVTFLVETVAAQYPEITVEFKDVSFVAEHIQGALKRLLPPRRMAEARSERDGRNTEGSRAKEDLFHFVSMTMRLRGNDAGPELFLPQVNVVMSGLAELGITERRENDNLDGVITHMIVVYETGGADGIQDIVARVRAVVDGNNAGDEGNTEGAE